MDEYTTNPPLKCCTLCKQWKPATPEYFNPHKQKKDGLNSWCNSCSREKSTQYRRAKGIPPKVELPAKEGYKCCTKCLIEYPATSEFFDAQKRGKYGLRSVCKQCTRARDHARYQTDEFREYMRVRMRSYSQKPEYQEYVKVYRRKRWSNPEVRAQDKQRKQSPEYKVRQRERMRQRRENPTFREYMKEYLREYGKRPYVREKHRKWTREYGKTPQGREAKRILLHRRLARKRSLPDTMTTAQWLRAVDYFGGKCAACGKTPGFWTALIPDHWIPLSAPNCTGTVATNIVPLCHAKRDGEGSCNLSKSNIEAAEWLSRHYGKKKAAEILARIETYFEWVRQQDQ